uniref:Uncharacterized protein n=1 Tax=Mola mola TaxID=94237 RepID=A0A3Q3WJ62_MOLML
MIALNTVLPILWWEHRSTKSTHGTSFANSLTLHRRAIGLISICDKSSKQLPQILCERDASSCSASFGGCLLIGCGNHRNYFKDHVWYLCATEGQCEVINYDSKLGRCDCESWFLILANTGKDWGYSNPTNTIKPSPKSDTSSSIFTTHSPTPSVTDLFAYSSARPTLFTTPAPLLPDLDPLGFHCICSALSFLFPVTSNTTTPPVFMPEEGNYTCLTRINLVYNMSQLLIFRSWSGTCTLVRLTLPLLIMGHHKDPKQMQASRSVQTDFDLTKNSPTYVNAIVANGFESLLFWINPNKNVDRINYVHYNIQWLANLTRDAVAVQNRMSLDMLLAERGGVCSMFGSACCTFIPNNTAPDGSVTRALEGLRILSNEMAEHSEIEDSIDDWFTSTFRKYIISLLLLLLS